MDSVKKERKRRKRTVYIACLPDPDAAKNPLSCANWGAGWNKKETKWYKYPVDLAEFESRASAFDYIVGEGWGHQVNWDD